MTCLRTATTDPAAFVSLENGAIFEGRGFGASVPMGARWSFTAGYASDHRSAYARQILVRPPARSATTASRDDVEKPTRGGFIVREHSQILPNHRAPRSSPRLARRRGVPPSRTSTPGPSSACCGAKGDGGHRAGSIGVGCRTRWPGPQLESMSGYNWRLGRAEAGTFDEPLGEWRGMVGESTGGYSKCGATGSGQEHYRHRGAGCPSPIRAARHHGRGSPGGAPRRGPRALRLQRPQGRGSGGGGDRHPAGGRGSRPRHLPRAPALARDGRDDRQFGTAAPASPSATS